MVYSSKDEIDNPKIQTLDKYFSSMIDDTWTLINIMDGLNGSMDEMLGIPMDFVFVRKFCKATQKHLCQANPYPCGWVSK